MLATFISALVLCTGRKDVFLYALNSAVDGVSG